MKKYLYIFLFSLCQLLITNFLIAQVSDPGKINPRAVKMYNEGIAKATENRFDDAISYLLQAIYLDSNYTDAYLSLPPWPPGLLLAKKRSLLSGDKQG